MSREISERDWKYLSRLRPVALERFCGRVLAEVDRISARSEAGSHERYLEVYDLIRRRDRELAAAFNGLRRSSALMQLLAIVSLGLLTDEEIADFGDETRAFLGTFPPARRDGPACDESGSLSSEADG
jgi:hypothetical protein